MFCFGIGTLKLLYLLLCCWTYVAWCTILQDNLQCSPSSGISNINTIYARNKCHKCDWLGVKLTVLMLYHNECNSLRFLVHSWVSLPVQLRSQLRLLVIDDNSEIPACRCVDMGTRLEDSGVSIIRVDDDRKWNIGGARNMGAFFTCSEFIFVCDIDAYVSPTLLENVLRISHDSSAIYQLHQFNRNFTKSTTKFHPGMMLVSREAYWKNNGCDEDFVGHYGQTDPHFRHNFAQRPDFEIVQNKDIYMCTVKSPMDDSMQSLLPKLDRNTAPNKKLIKMKLSRRVLWNHTILRFRWHEDDCKFPTSLYSLKNYPEVDHQVSAMMQSPIDKYHAFPIRSWAKGIVCDKGSGSIDPHDPCNVIGC